MNKIFWRYNDFTVELGWEEEDGPWMFGNQKIIELEYNYNLSEYIN